MPPRERRVRVEDILDAIAKIEQYVSGLSFEQFRADQKIVDAVVRNLEVIGEAVRHLSADPESLPAGIPWTDIAGMRNILIHESILSKAVEWKYLLDSPARGVKRFRLQNRERGFCQLMSSGGCSTPVCERRSSERC